MSQTAVAQKPTLEREYATPVKYRKAARERAARARARSRTQFADWVERMGEARLAGICGIATVTAHVWKYMGYVPRPQWPELLVALEPEGLTLRDLLRMEADYQSKLPK